MFTRIRRTLPLLFALVLLAPASAFADALVIVKVKSKTDTVVDGKVQLKARKGEAAFSCQTKKGECRIDAVKGGAYTVTFTPDGKKATKPRNVMIAPAGTVTLYVSAKAK